MSEGVESLIPILETMDFESQYATAQSFLFMQQDLKAKIEARYFNVAMLPDAKPEFLESIFQDRQPGWMHALLAMYDEEFRKRALASLPSIQQRMIADQANVAVTPSAAWGALRELNDEILDRVARGELALQSIFHEEPLAIAGGAEPATGAAVEPPQANEPQTAEQAYEPEGGNQNAA
jgi:hypothetical protein